MVKILFYADDDDIIRADVNNPLTSFLIGCKVSGFLLYITSQTIPRFLTNQPNKLEC
jgi:hypothetical protein